MSNPSFSNIDLWLFEYSEGNLSPEQIAQLESFLLQHPDLQIDKDMWDLSYVVSEPVDYPNQKQLERKRPVALYWITTTAATLLLIGGFSLYSYLDFDAVDSNQIAQHTQRSSSSIKSKFKTSANQKNGVKEGVSGSSKSTSFNQFSMFGFNNSIGSFEYLENEFAHKLSFFKNNSNLDFNRRLRNTQGDFYIGSLPNHSQLAFNDNQINDLASNESTSKESNSASKNNKNHKQLKINKLELKGFDFDKMNTGLFKFKKKESEPKTWKLKRKSAKNSSSSHGSAKKSMSLASKLRAIHRKIEKMIDNPIALKNLKDPYYHVPGMNSVDVNFGATGTLLATRVQTTSRYQWLGNTNEQLSNQVLIDGYAYPLRGGVGLQVNQSVYHKNGVQNTFAAITYSPKFSVTKNVTVEPAIRFKMGNKRIDESAFTVGQLIEVDRQNVEQFYSEDEAPKGKSLWYKDVGLSVMVNTKWFFAGIQVDNLAQHPTNIFGSNGMQRAPLHTVFTIGTDYQSKNKKIGFSPYLIYQNYGSLSEAWLGTNFRASWLTLGAGISSNIEPAASIGVKLKHVSINYNADLTYSQLQQKNILSHQLSLRFITNHSRVGKRLLTL